MNWDLTALGIELGSTTIKATLLDEHHKIIAEGFASWENQYVNHLWTYSLEDITKTLQACYAALKKDVKEKHNVVLKEVGAIGISAMMHGYIALDENDNFLVPFRTWRNNNAAKRADELTEIFHFHIPARWSIAHLYETVSNKEEHVSKIKFLTTLAGYIHYRLTGKKVMGIGEASGMFPIDPIKKDYDENMLNRFDGILKENNLPFKLKDILPEVLVAGDKAGKLTEEGASFLDPEGDLKAGIPFCPPEGDAGTGMVATNSISQLTGNISAGTSIFGMVVLNKRMQNYYPELDIVTTPCGDEVAMVHCNNCTNEINAWMRLFKEYSIVMGHEDATNDIYTKLFLNSLEGDDNCGDLLVYNYLSGENITAIEEGRPLFVRRPDSTFNLKNFIRAQIYSSMVSLKIGMDILIKKENFLPKVFYAHGGIFKTKNVASKYLASALNTPINIMEGAEVGGSYGMALLASFLLSEERDLQSFLNKEIFASAKSEISQVDEKIHEGFERYAKQFLKGLSAEKEAGRI